MLSHELAKELMKHQNMEIIISIDVSTGEEDFGKRVFADIVGVQADNNEVVILGEGNLND